MCNSQTINFHHLTARTAILVPVKSDNRRWVILDIFEQSRHYRIFFMKTFYNVISSVISCAKEAHALIVQNMLIE